MRRIFFTLILLAAPIASASWYDDLRDEIKNYDRSEIDSDFTLVSDSEHSFYALIANTSKWQKKTDEVLKIQDKTFWETEGYTVRDDKVRKKGAYTRSRKVLATDALTLVVTESYHVSKSGKAFALVAVSKLEDEQKALDFRNAFERAFEKQNEVAWLRLFIKEAYATELRTTSRRRSSTPQQQPAPECRNLGTADTSLFRRANERDRGVSLSDLNTTACRDTAVSVLQGMAISTLDGMARMMGLSAVADAVSVYMTGQTQAQRINRASQAMINWFRDEHTSITQLARNLVGGQLWSCLNHAKKVELTCQVATILATAVTGPGAVRGLAALPARFGGQGVAVTSRFRLANGQSGQVQAARTPAAAGAFSSIQTAVNRAVQSGQLQVVRIVRNESGPPTAVPINPPNVVPGRYYAAVRTQNGRIAIAEYDSVHGGHTALARAVGVPVLRRLDRDGQPAGGVIFDSSGVSISGKILRYPDPRNAADLSRHFRRMGFRIRVSTGGSIRETNPPATPRSSGRIEDMRAF